MGCRTKILTHWGFRLLLVAVASVGASSSFADCAPSRVELRGDWGRASFTVELADDADERAAGLMYREELPSSAGMLFLYPRPQRVAFWMKNTLIPLDMIFIDEHGIVQRVHANAIPHDVTPIDGGSGILAVLEINGGLAGAMGITPGSEIRFSAMDQEKAAWRCQ